MYMSERLQQDICKHKRWSILTGSQGDRNGITRCRDCDLWLTHAEKLSWESLKNQKSVSVVSIILSIIAIVVSIVALWKD